MIQYVFVDSSNRSSTKSGNSYTIYLTSPVKNIKRADLVLANVPNTLYNVTSAYLTINGSQTFTIPDGFYSAQGLSIYLNSILPGISVDYLQNEGKFIFYANFSFTMTIGSSLQKPLGYPLATSSNTQTVYTNLYKTTNYILSTSVIDLSTTEFIFLDVNELRNGKVIDGKQMNSSGTYDGTTIARTFAGIPLDVNTGQIKTFKETSDYKYSIYFEQPIDSISALNIRWTDKNGNIVSFNGNEQNSFLLRFYCTDREPEMEPQETREEELLRRIERTLQDSIPPPVKPSGPPRFLLIGVIVLLMLISIYLFKTRTTQVVQTPLKFPQTNLQPPTSIYQMR